MSAALTLPDPQGGCSCTPNSQDAGDGLVEHLLDYDPACPEHSTHLYDPRRGEWTIRPTDFGPREPTDAEIEAAARALAELAPGEPWPSNEDLGGHPVLGTRDDEFRDGMRDDARRALIAARAIS